jgi:hypothetical protein
MGGIGRAVMGAYNQWRRVRDGVFSRLTASALAECGPRTRLSLPVMLHHPERIHLGSGVYFGPGCWLQALPEEGDDTARLEIGDQCSFAGYDVVAAARRVVIEEGVLFARNVYVSDHVHAFGDAGKAIQDQGISKLAEVVIEEGAWLGQNVVVCPGVRIGKGAVIGAGSLVNRDIPARCVAVGSPAKVIKQLDAS